jgi:hypothetical protein
LLKSVRYIYLFGAQNNHIENFTYFNEVNSLLNDNQPPKNQFPQKGLVFREGGQTSKCGAHNADTYYGINTPA